MLFDEAQKLTFLSTHGHAWARFSTIAELDRRLMQMGMRPTNILIFYPWNRLEVVEIGRKRSGEKFRAVGCPALWLFALPIRLVCLSCPVFPPSDSVYSTVVKDGELSVVS